MDSENNKQKRIQLRDTKNHQHDSSSDKDCYRNSFTGSRYGVLKAVEEDAVESEDDKEDTE